MISCKIKRFTALLLVLTMVLSGCSASVDSNNTSISSDADTAHTSTDATASSEEQTDTNTGLTDAYEDEEISFSDLDDPELLQYIEDSIYAELEYELGSDDYSVESITTAYISTEYLEELAFNSQENIYFGYSLSELENQFEGERYVFTTGDDGKTVVQTYDESIGNAFDDVLLNVAIGSGVILACVTISAASGALGGTAVSVIFAASAKAGTIAALSSGSLGTVSAGIITGLETGDFEEALNAAVSSGSNSFKWGAVTGVIAGGISAAISLKSAAASAIRSPYESEEAVLALYGGSDQVTYLAGEEVAYGTAGATRPDVVTTIDGELVAIEVKNYDLTISQNRSNLYAELKRQITERVSNLPDGMSQMIVIDAKGRNYSSELIETVTLKITSVLETVYSDIPIVFLTA